MPLESIVKKPLSAAPPWLQWLLLRIQKYDYAIIYKPGKELMAPDMLSRAPLPETGEKRMEEINYHVHKVIFNLPATDEIRRNQKRNER